MKIRILLLLFFLVAMIIIWGILRSGRKQPDILLITLDTTRLDHLSCYGYKRKTSPNLDLLAEEGQRFENAIAVSSWTLPAHASLFTGLFPATHGARYSEEGEISLNAAIPDLGEEIYGWFLTNRLPEEALTLAEALRAAGYATGGIGAGPWLEPIFGLAQGFDFYDSDIRSVAGRRADRVNALAVPFIRKNADRPFFLFLNYFDPHAPFEPPPAFTFKFFPENKTKDMADDPVLAEAFAIARYDAEIFYMDMQIGLIFDELKNLGLYKDTCIIVMGDHGEHFGEHGLSGHGYSLFEKAVRAPLIIKWPGGWKALSSNKEMCQQVDIMPTILQRLGVELPRTLEGAPLGEVSHPVVCELYKSAGNIKKKGDRFDRHLKALYDGRYKLIRSSKQEDPDAGLFDLSVDPDEKEDLSKVKPGLAESLQSQLEQWERTLQAPLPAGPVESIDRKTEEQLKALGYAD